MYYVPIWWADFSCTDCWVVDYDVFVDDRLLRVVTADLTVCRQLRNSYKLEPKLILAYYYKAWSDIANWQQKLLLLSPPPLLLIIIISQSVIHVINTQADKPLRSNIWKRSSSWELPVDCDICIPFIKEERKQSILRECNWALESFRVARGRSRNKLTVRVSGLGRGGKSNCSQGLMDGKWQ